MMNLKNKILIAIMFALGTILWSCDSLIYDNLKDCPQGVYVKFYSMTPCETDSSFIGEVPSVTLFAFDENDKLVLTKKEDNVNLSKDYNMLVPVSNGNFSFIGWAGIDNNFDVESFTPGSTTKKDVMLTLKSNNNVATNLSQTKVWHGESPVVSLPDPAEFATIYKYTAINLHEVTNRISLTVEIDTKTMKEHDTSKIFAEVSSANSIYNIDCSMPSKNQQAVTYPTVSTSREDDKITWNYALMDLQTGYSNNLHIYYTGNDEEGETIFDGDLIAAILLRAVEHGVNLNCENDFAIKFVIKDYCVECWTHFSCDIYVNDWKVHSYETEL